MNENLPVTKRPFENLQEAIMDAASSQAILAEQAKGNKPRQFIFRMKLVDAAEIVERLIADEDFGVINHLKLNKPKKSSGTDDRVETGKVPPGMTGVAVFKCNRNGKPAEEKREIKKAKGKPVQRIRDSKGCNCRAEIRIKFGDFYHKKDGCVLNVDDFGDRDVEVAWKRDHNHKRPKVDKYKEIEMKEHVRKAIALGMSWPQFSAARKKLLLCDEQNQVPPEMLRVDYQYWFNEGRRQIRSQAVKDEDREKSLRKWACEIKQDKGMAAFTDRFQIDQRSPATSALKTPQGHKVWSFSFMDIWQKGLLEANDKVLFLDSTHKTARGLHQQEDVYLFTLYVKNQLTGKGAPAAFMITNSGCKETIADFLKQVRKFARCQPKQIVIDCDLAETKALNEVFGEDANIVWCRWHISKAFANKLRSKVTSGTRGDMSKTEWEAHKQKIEQKKQEITEAFKRVVASSSKEIGEQRMEDFMRDFEEFPQLIEYTAKQWFSKKEYIVNGWDDRISSGALTNNYIEAFHNVLKRYFLGRSRSQRPDFLVFKLFKNVVPSYKADEILLVRSGRARNNDKGEKLAHRKAFRVPGITMRKMVTFVSEGRFKVQSFTDSNVFYSVGIDEKFIVHCTCKAYENSSSWCKHIFLGRRWKLTPFINEENSDVSDEQLDDMFEYSNVLADINEGVEDDEDADLINFAEVQDSISEGGEFASVASKSENGFVQHVEQCQVVDTYNLSGTATPVVVEALSPGSPVVVDDYDQGGINCPMNEIAVDEVLFGASQKLFEDIGNLGSKQEVRDFEEYQAGITVLKVVDGPPPEIPDHEHLAKVSETKARYEREQANKRSCIQLVKSFKGWLQGYSQMSFEKRNRLFDEAQAFFQIDHWLDDANRKQRR